ncbi:MAG: porin [Rhizobiales bacterium]|nr:porin [Hyphomicrobiales bacterium]
MIGGLFGTSSRLAIVAAGLFVGGAALSPAQAADLGGDCCADLEERVAELEATTVRHANRKISLSISGQVNQALLWFDNNEEADVYVIDNDESSTRLNFKGQGTVRPGLTIGFQIEFDLQMGNNFTFDANDGDDGDLFQFRRAEWFIRDDALGTLTVGQGSMASDGAHETSFSEGWYAGVGYGLGITNNYISLFDDNSGLYFQSTTWATIGTDHDASRRNRVRYDSPTFAGFTLSASWGEDDEWDTALRYANEWNGLRVAAAISYHEDHDDNTCFTNTVPENHTSVPGALTGNDSNCTYTGTWGGSIAFLHVPSGIHLQGGYSEREFFNTDGNDAVVSLREANEAEHWWIAAGIQGRWNSLGESDVSIQYIENTNQGVLGLDYTNWAISFTQHIDAVGATAYISYHHEEFDDNALFGVDVDGEIDRVLAGMRVRF